MKTFSRFSAVFLIAATAVLGFAPPTTHSDRIPDQVIPLANSADDPLPLAPFAEKGLDWLAAAQASNGGWGAGSHSRQDITDPDAVEVDLATSAFAALALVRAGSTLKVGPYRDNIRRALDHILAAVEAAPDGDAPITNIQGTQPQAKLGQNIDASMAAQFLTQMLSQTKNDARLHRRVAVAVDKCLSKLAGAQQADGSWNNGGWAPVLQSAMANSAFEMASNAGREVDQELMDRSRDYQAKNVGADGDVRTEAAAGIGLYAIASSQRALAPEVNVIRERVRAAKASGALPAGAEVTEASLVAIGFGAAEAKKSADTFRRYDHATELLASDEVLSGFGNNGGEEFLSYMMTAESIATASGPEWKAWHAKMSNRLERVQNADGSWSGHHCITSPVFSTAAVLMTLTADRGLELVQSS